MERGACPSPVAVRGALYNLLEGGGAVFVPAAFEPTTPLPEMRQELPGRARRGLHATVVSDGQLKILDCLGQADTA